MALERGGSICIVDFCRVFEELGYERGCEETDLLDAEQQEREKEHTQ
jgi:hypothetical protein